MIEFSLSPQTDHIELGQLLKAVNLCQTGGEAKHFIKEGHVTVDGQIETRNGRKIYPGQSVEFYSKRISVKSVEDDAVTDASVISNV
jgi:ribosome-associated protein